MSISLLEPQSLRTDSSPSYSSHVPSQAYVLSIVALPGCYAASASSPSNAIPVFDSHTLQLQQTFPGHECATTSLRATNWDFTGFNSATLVSSGKDGTVKTWDSRISAAALTLRAPGYGLLSCDVSPDGLSVAAGTDLQNDDASIFYWDIRKPDVPLRVHSSTHSDDITAVHFQPPSSNTSHLTLVSASSDGLISISNADEDDEDECVLNVGNWGCSISQVGWICGPTPGIWAASDMETFSIWSNDLDLVHDMDIRSSSAHSQNTTWVTDYVITAHSSPQLEVFSVLVGSNEGDIALISPSRTSHVSSPWTLSHLWTNGHVGVVRSALWDEKHGVLLTGGEDSKICLWPGPGASISLSDAMDVDEA